MKTTIIIALLAVGMIANAAGTGKATKTTTTTTTTTTTATADCEKETTFPEISTAELKSTVDSKGAYVIDVNGTKSFKKAAVPTAVDYETIKKDLAKALPADKNAQIVAYCGGPSCGAWKKAATEACKMGYTNVKHYKEGIKGWTETYKN